VAVITGGNSGIGLAAAKRLQEEGAKVAIFGRRRKTLDEVVETVGHGVVAVQGDVAKLTDVDKLYAEVSQKLGKIDVLFVNATAAKTATGIRGIRCQTFFARSDANVNNTVEDNRRSSDDCGWMCLHLCDPPQCSRFSIN
jgi:NAD(P)-dependent dehydrogenase (short-subunit alcohol dehydrogenase family)